MTVFRKNHVLKKLNFDQLTLSQGWRRGGGGGGGGSRVRSFDFDLLTPSPGSGGALFHKKQTRGPSGPKSLT